MKDDWHNGFIIGVIVCVLIYSLLAIFLIDSQADYTCEYFERLDYVTISENDVCYIETESGFLPVEDLLEIK